MLISSMASMMEFIGPSSIKHLDVVAPQSAKGLVHNVYAQMRKDFFVASPFVLHSIEPEVLVVVWSLVRETLFCGLAPRSHKELVAAGVSRANSCPFCVDAHYSAVRYTKLEDSALETWAQATSRASNPELKSKPFSEHDAEYLGTVVAFQYLNRLVSVFMDERLMPAPHMFRGVVLKMTETMMGGMLRKARKNKSGDSFGLLEEYNGAFTWTPEWAKQNPNIAEAIARWSAVIENRASELLDNNLLAALGRYIDEWDGEKTQLAYRWAENLSDIDGFDKDVANVALRTVVAPYTIDELMVKNLLLGGMTQQQVLVLVAWSAQRAARRVGTWIA